MPSILSSKADKSSVLYEGRARVSEISDIPGMNESWQKRLARGIKANRLSQRRVSLDAGMGPGYVNSLIKEGKDPTVEHLIAVCRAAELSLSWVLFGVEISAETEQLMELLENAPKSKRESLLNLLKEET